MKDKKPQVALDYTFLFEPSSTYQHLYQFEQDLSKFFAEHGMEVEPVKSIEGGGARRILCIYKKEEAPKPPLPLEPKKVTKFITNQQKILSKKK